MDIVERLRDEASMYDADDVDLHLDAVNEIERLRKALQKIAAPSKLIVKGEEAVVALRLVLSSHRRTARKALGEGD